ncbi:LOW QUALITY PROTEIN: claudin-7-A [Vanacampus margaritifer]
MPHEHENVCADKKKKKKESIGATCRFACKWREHFPAATQHMTTHTHILHAHPQEDPSERTHILPYKSFFCIELAHNNKTFNTFWKGGLVSFRERQMANSGIQLLGFFMSLTGIVGLIIGTILPQWKMSAYIGDNIITAVAMYQGLWMSCAFQSTGQLQCKIYDSILQLDSSLQATRALMIVGIIVSVAGLGVACMGMKCTTCGGGDKLRKARVAMTGGIILLVGGLCAIVACSWFAHNVIRAFYNPYTPVNTKFEFGAAIFIAWGGSLLDVLGGAMLAASCPRKKQVSKYPSMASSRCGPDSSNKEYV